MTDKLIRYMWLKLEDYQKCNPIEYNSWNNFTFKIYNKIKLVICYHNNVIAYINHFSNTKTLEFDISMLNMTGKIFQIETKTDTLWDREENDLGYHIKGMPYYKINTQKVCKYTVLDSNSSNYPASDLHSVEPNFFWTVIDNLENDVKIVFKTLLQILYSVWKIKFEGKYVYIPIGSASEY